MIFCMFALNYKYDFLPGAYIPLTVEGNIIVDGVLASCHASADHGVAHFFYNPHPVVSLDNRVDIWWRQWVSSFCYSFRKLGSIGVTKWSTVLQKVEFVKQ